MAPTVQTTDENDLCAGINWNGVNSIRRMQTPHATNAAKINWRAIDEALHFRLICFVPFLFYMMREWFSLIFRDIEGSKSYRRSRLPWTKGSCSNGIRYHLRRKWRILNRFKSINVSNWLEARKYICWKCICNTRYACRRKLTLRRELISTFTHCRKDSWIFSTIDIHILNMIVNPKHYLLSSLRSFSMIMLKVELNKKKHWISMIYSNQQPWTRLGINYDYDWGIKRNER